MKVFCTLIEFAFINFVDVFIRRLKMKDIERAMILKEVFYQRDQIQFKMASSCVNFFIFL